MTHEEWWNEVGSALRPLVGEDAHEHVKRVTAICWVAARAAIYEAEAAQLTAPLRAQVAQYKADAERWQFWRVRYSALCGMQCARKAGIDLSRIYVDTPEKMDAVTDAAIDKARKS